MTANPNDERRLLALRPLRHACHACGTCCQGWKVWLRAEELPAIDAAARQLGVERPHENMMLRMEGGRCVFLSDANLCRIHAEIGPDAKPHVCKVFPRRAFRAEDGLRVGIDPGCTSTDRSWLDGPEIDPPRGSHEDRIASPELAASERALIGLAQQPDMTVARLIGVMLGAPEAAPEVPRAFALRLVKALQVHDFVPFVTHTDQGPAIGTLLGPVAQHLRTLDAARPPAWAGTLSPAHEAFALEVFRRHLFQRIGDKELPPVAQALLVLAGVMACGWALGAAPDAHAFPAALSVWLRLIRARAFWSAILPETDTARWLLTGAGAAPAGPPDV